MEEIFANDMMDRALIPNICKQLIQHDIKKNNPTKKWAEELNQKEHK